jgi:hypothetical protein
VNTEPGGHSDGDGMRSNEEYWDVDAFDVDERDGEKSSAEKRIGSEGGGGIGGGGGGQAAAELPRRCSSLLTDNCSATRRRRRHGIGAAELAYRCRRAAAALVEASAASCGTSPPLPAESTQRLCGEWSMPGSRTTLSSPKVPKRGSRRSVC